jgi:uncharacterized membrane protein YhaH (DUF805 family)
MADEWFYADGQNTRGPESFETLLAVLAAKSDWQDLLVWHDGYTDWRRAADVPEVSVHFMRPPPLPKRGVTQQAFALPQEVSPPSGDPVIKSSHVVRVLRFLFSFYGRTQRSMYWLGMGVVYAMFGFPLLWSSFHSSYVVSFIVGLWMFLWLASLFAIVSKRLHDLSFSAWWLVVANAILFVSILSRVELAEQISTFVFGSGLILIGCFKGTSGPNRFGDEQV